VDPLTRNRYAYVNGDPANLVDPSGHGPGCGDIPVVSGLCRGGKDVLVGIGKGIVNVGVGIVNGVIDIAEMILNLGGSPEAIDPETGEMGPNRGYFHLPRVKGVDGPGQWLPQSLGRAVPWVVLFFLGGRASEPVPGEAPPVDAPGTTTTEGGPAGNGTPLNEGTPRVPGSAPRTVRGNATTPEAATSSAAETTSPGLSTRGVRPAPGTRVRPEGVPENWRIRPTDQPGGTHYFDPANPQNSVRVMQGNRNSPFIEQRSPYVRWDWGGHALDVSGNKLPSPRTAEAHIPLEDFRFLPEVFR
jgi:hypothetical protein